MIDRRSRDEFADALEKFADGLISNDEFEKSFVLSKDKAINALFRYGAWHLFSDLEEHKIEDKQDLSVDTRENIERWICFLRSDIPYEWPNILWVYNAPGYFLIFLTLGLLHIYAKRVIANAGEIEAWPFLSKDYYHREKNLQINKEI